ncbi:MAG: DUF1801 domain-containing protein [Pseudomonadota bacterium]
MQTQTIDGFHAVLTPDDRAICDALRALIAEGLSDATAKVWHAHPVWFLNDNPIVGYSKLKNCVRLFFWSGQSFQSPGLSPSGTFKAAERRYTHVDQIDRAEVQAWLDEAPSVQWNYRDIRKTKGQLHRLV